MKRFFFLLLLLMSFKVSYSQQLFGDMNKDNRVSVADVTKLADMVANDQTDIPLFDPYMVNNKPLYGKWYRSPTEYYTFNEDGTYSYSLAENNVKKYRLYYNLGRLCFIDLDDKSNPISTNLTFFNDSTILFGFALSAEKVYYKETLYQPVDSIMKLFTEPAK